MKNINFLLRDQLKNFKPYVWELEEEKYGQKYQLKKIVRFDTATPAQIPNIWPDFIQIIDQERAVNDYKDPGYFRLKKAVTQYEQLPKNMVTLTNSGDEAIDVICKTFLNQNDNVIICPPTYGMYKVQTAINGGEVLEVPLKKNWQLDTQKIINTAKKHKTKIIFLCSPNNPTGTSLDKLDIEYLAQKTNSIILIDEAYREFCEDNFNDLALKYNNVVILRSFSKFACIAGARVGYLIANKQLTKIFDSIRFPMGVSYFSQEIALSVLTTKGLKFIEKFTNKIKQERSRVTKKYLENNFNVIPSEANFFCLYLPGKTAELVEQLKREGLFIKNVSGKKNLNSAVRIGIRAEKDNDLLFEKIKNFYAEN
ncbi:MAG: aminotransferase class I/II-fold pyridoxal phosphate-dependent enzyme [Candidatus Woesebacteria bacterium]|jgi:histidinol-phosphate aminotransferase